MATIPITDPPTAQTDPSESPVYWFVKLETAVEYGDFAHAACAQRELERLGVTVRYNWRSRLKVVNRAT